MKVNSDAIFGSHAWTFEQEVPDASTPAPATSQKAPSNSVDARVGADAVSDITSTSTVPELRFTAKGNDIFLFAMSWQEALVKSKSLSSKNLSIKEVEMLGTSEPLSWHQDEAGLTIQLPHGYATAAMPIYVFRLGKRGQEQGCLRHSEPS
ncbi:MAG: alpha-L-fucosidase C-terminal domain-containing protein [Edaphobacter sp.]